MTINVGILALQGDIEENISATEEAFKNLGMDGKAIPVKYAHEISNVDALILPGGESTVIGTLAKLGGSLQIITERIRNGMPVMGTCAGMIMMAKRAYDKVVGETRQQLLGLLDITVERNAFGRQIDSFEADLELRDLGMFKGVFIRAPVVTEVGSNVSILAKLGERIVAVKEGNIIATAFHPELSGDSRLHEYLIKMVRRDS